MGPTVSPREMRERSARGCPPRRDGGMMEQAQRERSKAVSTTKPVEVQGTLREDGTLVLDEKPNLPPGRVKVTVEPVPDLTQTEIWQFFERIWAEQRARGHVPRTREQIDA